MLNLSPKSLRRHIRRSIAMAVLCSPILAVRPTAAQTTPFACGTIYGSYSNGASTPVYDILGTYSPSTNTFSTTVGGATVTLTTPNASGGTNSMVAALAVDPLLDFNGRRRIYYTDNTTSAKLYYYDGVSVVSTGISLTAPFGTITAVTGSGTSSTLTDTFNRMAFAPDGTLYITDGQKTIFRYSPNRLTATDTTGTTTSVAITDNPNNAIKLSQSFGGDIAFDSVGRMYILAYDSNPATEFRLFQVNNPAGTAPNAVLLGRNTTADTIAGLAFQSGDNSLYMQGSTGKSFSWNLATNVVTTLTATTKGSADLGSCTYPNLDSIGAFKKTVKNLTHPTATTLIGGTSGDILEYTLTIQNTGTLVAGNATLVDQIPTGTTYVPGSTTLNGTLKPDLTGNLMPYTKTNTAAANTPSNATQINSPTQPSGILTTTSPATIVFQVKVSTSGSNVCNQGKFNYDGATAEILSNDPITLAANDSTCIGTTSVSGKVWNDKANTAANTFNIVTTGLSGTNAVFGTNTIPVKAILVNTDTGFVIGSTIVNADGTYSFIDVPINTNVKVILSPTAGVLSPPSAPPTTALSTIGWTATSPIESTTFSTGLVATTGKDFGIRQKAKLVLVKRITKINGQTTNPNGLTISPNVPLSLAGTSTDTFNFNTIKNPSQAVGYVGNWPTGYIVGATDAGIFKPGDTIEYTIYFLNNQGADATVVKICDPIRGNQTYVPKLNLTSAGLAANDSPLTDAIDSTDRANSYLAGNPPTGCNLNITSYAGFNTTPGVAIDITGALTPNQPALATVPGATAAGTPITSYGLFRFTTKVKP
jgi:uncharacterized repeat protein (TIGR01451 family)